MLLNGVAELGTIGAVVPLLALISHPESLERYPAVLHALAQLGADSATSRIAAAAIVFALFAVASGALRIALTRTTYDWGYGLAHELALEIQRRLLLQPYSFHVQRNTSTLVSALEKTEICVFDVVLPLLQAATSAFISIFIIAIFVIVDPLIALIGTALLAAIYLIASQLSKRTLAASSGVISRSLSERVKIVQESFGGIRDAILDGSQASYLAKFDSANGRLGRAYANTAFVSLAPRYVLETFGIVAIAAIALTASLGEGGFAAALPVLGAFALGAQRLLPLIQQIYRGWSTARGHLSVVDDTVALLALEADERPADQMGEVALALRKGISFSNVSFAYPNRKSATLIDISFELPAGSALAVVGETGSGKTTLADLLMGLLEPDQGQISIDGEKLSNRNRRQWQRSIAHVPQTVFLADASIAANIALSLPERPADMAAVTAAAIKAQLHNFVMSLPEGYDTHVGERGIRLSGGQRQRLGLARAIYKGGMILVLDEATSALDEMTEAAVIDAMDELRRDGRTIVVIAHRPSTIRHCDLVARLRRGRLVEFGPLKASAAG